MRRSQEKSRKFIIIVALAGISTLLSFLFDQLVVQSENKIREISSELNQKRVNILNLQSTINNINSINFDISKSINNFKTNFDFFYLQNATLNVQLFGNEDEKLDYYNVEDEKKLKFKKNLKKIIQQNLSLYDDKIDQINFLNLQIVNNPVVSKILSNNEGYEIMREDLRKFKINNDFDEFPYDYYLSDEELLSMSEKEFQNQKDYLIYSKARDKMSEIDDIKDEYYDLIRRVQIEYNNAFIFFSDYLEYFSDNKNNKNLYILLSIFFQILALAILMFLFREMIMEKNG